MIGDSVIGLAGSALFGGGKGVDGWQDVRNIVTRTAKPIKQQIILLLVGFVIHYYLVVVVCIYDICIVNDLEKYHIKSLDCHCDYSARATFSGKSDEVTEARI